MNEGRIVHNDYHYGIKNSEMIVFDRSGHSPFVEERDLFLQVLEEFW